MARRRQATVADVHEIAAGLPEVERNDGPLGNSIYAIRKKSFVFFRNPRPDALDPATGERYTDVIVFWVPDEADKQAIVGDPSNPFFTTPHFDGYPAVLVRASRLVELSRYQLEEVITDAWLSRAPKRLAAVFLAEQGR
jgi:hypothetical protein